MPDILIVDDNEVTIKSVDTMLSKEGYNIVAASNGKDAIRLLGQFNFDLIITDLLMPFMSGIDFIKHIKADPACANLPLVVISSVGSEKTKMECYNLGVDVYLTKPITSTELVMMIRKLVRR